MRQYVAHHTYASYGERAISSSEKTSGTIWRGVRGRRQYTNLFFQVRDNNLSVVFVGVGGTSRDTIAILALQGAVYSVTVHVQCGERVHWQTDGAQAQRLL